MGCLWDAYGITVGYNKIINHQNRQTGRNQGGQYEVLVVHYNVPISLSDPEEKERGTRLVMAGVFTTGHYLFYLIVLIVVLIGSSPSYQL